MRIGYPRMMEFDLRFIKFHFGESSTFLPLLYDWREPRSQPTGEMGRGEEGKEGPSSPSVLSIPCSRRRGGLRSWRGEEEGG